MPPVFLPEKTHKICLESVPIVSVDVVLLNADRSQTLLFKRKNKPLEGIFYTLGGRVLKGESIVDTAVRKLKEEAGLEIPKSELFLGGIMEEFFDDSIYPEVETHNINLFFGYFAPEDLIIRTDDQHSETQWFDIASERLHPQVRYKISLLLSTDSFFYDPEINLSIPGKQAGSRGIPYSEKLSLN